MIKGTYTLRRAAGGVGHFARVVVACFEEGEQQLLGTTSQVWLAAARVGLDDAVAAADANGREWAIVSFDGTVADTSDEDAWVAAVMALFNALSVEANLGYEGTWVVGLPNGVQLRPPSRPDQG